MLNSMIIFVFLQGGKEAKHVFVLCVISRYDYLFDPDEADDCKVPCLCQTADCRKFMN